MKMELQNGEMTTLKHCWLILYVKCTRRGSGDQNALVLLWANFKKVNVSMWNMYAHMHINRNLDI